ncbi:unnamed protein product (macronuclear) [Paramecium tetraurelia]|uniref:Secreted protein n=1 Tax=Paramecium tetraurelia TaxID=5888 RepID=A0CI64_PARTE|nr:uncharacterized protein GSPATT00007616001 [Paramecium tetraurelia]CAK70481.1 unnamed protein product [Paramecium tetraurelia]|eukprot:XP_001437878.1 hypothetical protein (macronuclear) [Paramecium tetraurelia strain d4-2]
MPLVQMRLVALLEVTQVFANFLTDSNGSQNLTSHTSFRQDTNFYNTFQMQRMDMLTQSSTTNQKIYKLYSQIPF